MFWLTGHPGLTFSVYSTNACIVHQKLNLDIQSSKTWREDLRQQMFGYHILFCFNNLQPFNNTIY
jgi:hypothetical protein